MKCLENVTKCEGLAGHGDEIVKLGNNLKGLDNHGN